MDTNKESNAVPADLLARAMAAGVPNGVTLQEVDPMENVPTIGLGKGWAPGQTLSGYFEESQTAASPKFKSQTHNEKGTPTKLIHVLRIGEPNGPRLGIWDTAALKAFFANVHPGTFVQVTYLEKGVNGSGQAQHFFKFKKGAAQ